MSSLTKILEEGERLQSMNEKQTQRLVEMRISEAIIERVEERTAVKVEQCTVRTIINEKSEPSIHEIKVVLIHMREKEKQASSSSDEAASEADGDSMKIESVQPVEVRVQLEQEARSESSQTAHAELTSQEQKQTAEEVRAIIRQDWGVSDEVLTVAFSDAAGS